MYPQAGTYPGLPSYRRENWPKLSFVLLGFVCALQMAAFLSPGWYRRDSECGNTGLLVYQQTTNLLGGGCIYQSIAASLGDSSDTPTYITIEARYSLANDVLCCMIPIMLCFATLILMTPIMRGTARKMQFTGLSIQLLSIANVLQWSLVYKGIENNLSMATDGRSVMLFPYSILLFGLGTFLTSALSILHLVMYLRTTKITDKPYRL